MNIWIDQAIFQLQSQGGISRLWRSLIPALRASMPDATFDPRQAPDWWVSTYYRPAPIGVKSLCMVYDLIAERYPLITNKSDAVDIRRAVADATAVVSISRMTAQDVARRLGRDSVVAYPGVDEQFGKVSQTAIDQFRANIGKPYVLVVGRRGGYKNAQALYQAWAMWSGVTDHAVVCVGGEEPLPQDVAFAQRYDWRQIAPDDAELQAAYAGATALCYPSIMEGFGLPIVEALVCGCPVVCDRSVAEIAGAAGIYCDVLIPRHLAAALDVARDHVTRLPLLLSGIEWGRSFTWKNMATKVAEVLRAA